MRPGTFYLLLGALALAAAAFAGSLGIVAWTLSEEGSAGAAGICALIFLPPGLVFLAFARRMRNRDAALAHVARLVRAGSVRTKEDLARELGISSAAAEKIFRKTVSEGYADGTLDGQGRLVPAAGTRCPTCGAELGTGEAEDACPSCGARLGE